MTARLTDIAKVDRDLHDLSARERRAETRGDLDEARLLTDEIDRLLTHRFELVQQCDQGGCGD